MPYASLQDMLDRFGEEELVNLTDRAEPRAYAVDAAVADRALIDATALIDGYLSARHATPLAVVPQLVTAWCCDIARRRLYKDGPDEGVRKAHDDALGQLRDVAAGRLQLPVAAPAGQPPVGGGVRGISAAPVFTADTLRGFV